MLKVFIIGGSGKVARRLAQQLAARDHEPRALYRKAEQAGGLEALGAVPVQGDLLEIDADGLARRMAGSDVVVFSARRRGQGGGGVDGCHSGQAGGQQPGTSTQKGNS